VNQSRELGFDLWDLMTSGVGFTRFFRAEGTQMGANHGANHILNSSGFQGTYEHTRKHLGTVQTSRKHC